MTSQVFYRKWRPQTLSEVVGQEHVTKTLHHAVASERIAHAYLFCGPRGTGKTSTGRILAKAANCLSPVDGEPCNNCDICRAINEGSAPDIIEIDAASKTGVDDIRDLREKTNYAPNVARYKVYIIDEVHMISTAASNAFLKTLEEPPPHAIFILATTEVHKILPTILSRCQRFDFHRLSQSAVITKLETICNKEDITIDPEALKLIAKVTTGSLRDAENLLEQLAAYHGHNIGLDQVRRMLGIIDDLRTRELVKYIIEKDISTGLKVINSVSDDGIDLRQFNHDLITCLRELLLIKSGSDEIVDISRDNVQELKNLVTNTSLDYLLNSIKLFSTADFRLDNYSPLPLELALIESVLSTQETKQPVYIEPPVTVKPSKLEHELHRKPDEVLDREDERQLPQSASTGLAEPVTAETETERVATSEPQHEVIDKTSTEHVETSQSISPQDIDYIRSKWKEFVGALRGEGSRGNLDAFLRSACEPVKMENGKLTVGFYAKFHKEYIEDPKYKFLVEKKLREFFGHPYKLHCIIVESKKALRTEPTNESPLVKAALERGAKKIE